MIALADHLLAAVARFAERARRFFYAVALLGNRCPDCSGVLTMAGEGRCRCLACHRQFDPTVAFQRCSSCGGRPAIRVRRYRCGQCGQDVPSRFLFDGQVFDADYFRAKMAEHRERKRRRREQLREMLAKSRSDGIEPQPADLDAVPGLVEAINGLTGRLDLPIPLPRGGEFDLQRYQDHVRAHLGPEAIRLDHIPPLTEDPRRDLVWRFIAVIFLAHAGLADATQTGQTIMVIQRETHSKRQRLLLQLHFMSTVREGCFESPIPSTHLLGSSLSCSPTATTRTRTEWSSVTSRDAWEGFQPPGRA